MYMHKNNPKTALKTGLGLKSKVLTHKCAITPMIISKMIAL